MKQQHEEEWIMLFAIAEEDRKAFMTLLGTPSISLSVTCFHAQQASEKYIKSVLSKQRISFPFTHDLLELHRLLVDNKISMSVERDLLKKLNPFAVKQRYDRPPEILISGNEVKEIVDLIANWCKEQLHD